MLEIEIKSRISDPENIEKRIQSMGAIFIKEVYQEDYYFSHPCRDFRKTDEALRIRRMEGKWYITYKGPKIDRETKTRRELEIETVPEIIEILRGLGFEIAGSVKKRRKNYRLDDMEISIDDVENLGHFVEIETFGELREGKEKVLRLAEDIGLKDLERRSYFELQEDMKDEQG